MSGWSASISMNKPDESVLAPGLRGADYRIRGARLKAVFACIGALQVLDIESPAELGPGRFCRDPETHSFAQNQSPGKTPNDTTPPLKQV
jgi:hypothetical protein